MFLKDWKGIYLRWAHPCATEILLQGSTYHPHCWETHQPSKIVWVPDSHVTEAVFFPGLTEVGLWRPSHFEPALDNSAPWTSAEAVTRPVPQLNFSLCSLLFPPLSLSQCWSQEPSLSKVLHASLCHLESASKEPNLWHLTKYRWSPIYDSLTHDFSA